MAMAQTLAIFNVHSVAKARAIDGSVDRSRARSTRDRIQRANTRPFRRGGLRAQRPHQRAPSECDTSLFGTSCKPTATGTSTNTVTLAYTMALALTLPMVETLTLERASQLLHIGARGE